MRGLLINLCITDIIECKVRKGAILISLFWCTEVYDKIYTILITGESQYDFATIGKLRIATFGLIVK